MSRLGLFFALGFTACTAQPDRPFCEPGVACASASAATCAHGPEAERHGRTTFADGTCVAADDDACDRATLTCALWGQCHAPPPGYRPAGCTASDDRDFAASRDPACTAGTCLAIGDDCAAARVCALEGRCTAKDGVCVADAASCRKSELCKTIGWCTLVGAQCRPGNLTDCQASDNCRELGQCAFGKGQCSVCSRSPGCRGEGLCYPVANRCAAFIPKHCVDSAACQREGRCRLFQGACVQ